MHFYCEKLLLARNRDWGLNRPPEGAKDVKCMEGWKFSRGLNAPCTLLPSTRIAQIG